MNEIKEPNFIVARFGDNDYGHHIRAALDCGINEFGYGDKFCPIMWKRFITIYVASKLMLRHMDLLPINWDNAKQTSEYLNTMRVTFETKTPTEDHDGGSAAVCLKTGYSWVF